MCGIAGLLHFDSGRAASVEHVKRMSEALVHRGPDQAGVFHRGAVGLACQRLIIRDFAAGQQPMLSRDGSAAVVFNGEIDNFRELRAGLSALGYGFETQSDTEVILHAYAEYGIGCIERLDGMFAIAIWDERRRTLFLARDRLGIKPLFYCVSDGTLSFASEVKALLAGKAARANPRAIAEYLTCGFPLGANTLFEGISSLRPGHVLTANAGGASVREYWDVTFRPGRSAEGADLSGPLHGMLRDAVSRALDSDAPVGTCLSGGLDSTVVSALAAQDSPGLASYNIGYARNSDFFSANPHHIVGEVTGDDARYGSLAALSLGTAHSACVLPIEPLLDSIDDMIWHREKPLLALSEYGHYGLCREASKRVKVLLTGQGADELFGGYYYWWRFRGPENLRFFPWVARSDPAAAAGPTTRADLLASLASEDLALNVRRFEEQRASFESLMARAQTDDFFNKISYVLVKTHLHEMLELEDRHSMASSVEMRVPFLSHRLVDWALNLPAAAKVERGTEKLLLKEMARKFLPRIPEAIISRRKSPMPPPFDVGGLVRGMTSVLQQRDLAIACCIDRRRLDLFLSGLGQLESQRVGYRHYALYSLYFLERWFRLFDVSADLAS